ncbi:MAG: hypothetical protein V9G12_19625 [Microthrixaceae bacterium]
MTTGRDGELELDERLGAEFDVVRNEAVATAIAGKLAIEGERDGVEQRGLAGAGRAVDEEQALLGQSVEVDDLVTGVRAERREFEPMWSHETPTSGTPDVERRAR